MGESKAYASLSIQLGLDEGSLDAAKNISLELDEELNDGATSFDFGQKIHIRCFTFPEDMNLKDGDATDGTVSGPSGSGTVSIEDEIITFTNSNSASPAKPVSDGFSYAWMGNKNLGAVSIEADGSLKAAKTGTAVLKANYTSNYRKMSVTVPPPSSPPPDSYTVIAWVEEA